VPVVAIKKGGNVKGQASSWKKSTPSTNITDATQPLHHYMPPPNAAPRWSPRHAPFSCTSSSFLNLSFKFWNSAINVAAKGLGTPSADSSTGLGGPVPVREGFDAIDLLLLLGVSW